MTDNLDRALSIIGAGREQVLKHRQQGDDYIVILDLGIKGSPKHVIPLSQLPEQESMPIPAAVDLGGYGYRDLQALAKEYDIPANQKAEDLQVALEALFYGADEEE